MLGSVRRKDVVHIQIPRHVIMHVVAVIGVVIFFFVAVGATGALLYAHDQIAKSPAQRQPSVALQHDETPKPEPKPVDPPKPVYPHDYVIPPVVDGIPPVVTNFPTTDPVVFLTIDDGAFKDPSVVQLLKDNNLKASLFLAQSFILDNPDFFKQITDQGSLIENHTLSHDLRMLSHMGYDQMVSEICGMSDYIQQQYGRRPIFFRPPGGAYSDTMLRAAGACGMRAVVTWIAKANGGSMQYQIGDHLRPGDVVLMHFRPEFKQDLQAFIDAQNAAGLHTELLEDWVN